MGLLNKYGDYVYKKRMERKQKTLAKLDKTLDKEKKEYEMAKKEKKAYEQLQTYQKGKEETENMRKKVAPTKFERVVKSIDAAVENNRKRNEKFKSGSQSARNTKQSNTGLFGDFSTTSGFGNGGSMFGGGSLFGDSDMLGFNKPKKRKKKRK